MKKLAGLILVFLSAMILGGAVFAAQDTVDIPDPQVPGAPVENVDESTYDEPEIEIVDEEDVPGGSSDSSAKTQDIEEEKVPGALPKTGGIPAEVFYAAGAVLVVAALVLSRVKVKTDTKH